MLENAPVKINFWKKKKKKKKIINFILKKIFTFEKQFFSIAVWIKTPLPPYIFMKKSLKNKLKMKKPEFPSPITFLRLIWGWFDSISSNTLTTHFASLIVVSLIPKIFLIQIQFFKKKKRKRFTFSYNLYPIHPLLQRVQSYLNLLDYFK